VTAAVNDGLTKAKEMVNEEMGKLTKGMNLPNLPGLM
jgi:DNA-binding protein YbaB